MKTKEDANRVVNEITKEGFRQVYTFGNGGSCAIANHMEVDWTKNSGGFWLVQSLCANSAMITMIANDYGYEETCAQQLRWKANPYSELDPVVVLISSSGNSPNIVKAAELAKELEMRVIGFTGFGGGKLKTLSDVSIHIDSDDYEEAENYHHEVMHEVSRLLRRGI